MQHGPFRERVRTLYDAQGPRAAYPWIGERFETPDSGDFRALVLGINSYVTNPQALASSDPNWWSGWFQEGTWNFPRTAWAEANTLGSSLAGRAAFRETAWSGDKDSIYATNLVKTYLGGEYVDAARVGTQVLVDGAVVTAREFDLMAAHNCLPHVVIAYGRPIWDQVWPLFCPQTAQFPSYSDARVAEYVNLNDGSPLFHHANLVRLEQQGRMHDMLLVGLAHPARRKPSSKSAEWLLGQEDLEKLTHVGYLRD